MRRSCREVQEYSTRSEPLKWFRDNINIVSRVLNTALIVGLYFFTLYLKQVFVPIDKYEKDRISLELRYEKDALEKHAAVKTLVDVALTVDNRLQYIETALKLQTNNNEEHAQLRERLADHEDRLRYQETHKTKD